MVSDIQCHFSCRTDLTSRLPVIAGANLDSERSAVPYVAILMCTHFGQRFIVQQLESIWAQDLKDWSVYVSDDRSTDDTLAILGEYRNVWGDERLTIRPGPGRGFCANFLSLVCATDIRAHYYAFSDQDDLWDPDKLRRAATWLDAQPANEPALYCARTRLIDDDGRAIGFSPLFERPTSFRNALVQSIAGGNTMVFNNPARDLLIEAGADLGVQTHDWWAYMVVTGCGGRVHYDPFPTVGYRQHGGNLVGSNASFAGRLQRAFRLLQGCFRDMNDRNLAAMQRLTHRLSPESVNVLATFENARNADLAGRISGVVRSGVYCHTRLGNLGLAVAALLKKF